MYFDKSAKKYKPLSLLFIIVTFLYILYYIRYTNALYYDRDNKMFYNIVFTFVRKYYNRRKRF